MFSRFVGVLALSLCALPLVGQSTPASCSFTYFVPPAPYNTAFEANGINHYGTVVGQASDSTKVVGFVKLAGGAVSYFAMPGATYTVFNKRNANGATVGYYASSAGATGLLYTSSSHASLNYPNSYSTVLWGINKWNSIVGSYQASASSSNSGFKYNAGHFTKIQFPGSAATVAAAINDNGVIVGQYTVGSLENPPHGFVYANGTYKTLDVSTSGGGTQLLDINNGGTIVASPNLLYNSGTWKSVSAPGAYEAFVYGINDLNQVTGVANYKGTGETYTWKAFTASCK